MVWRLFPIAFQSNKTFQCSFLFAESQSSVCVNAGLLTKRLIMKIGRGNDDYFLCEAMKK